MGFNSEFKGLIYSWVSEELYLLLFFFSGKKLILYGRYIEDCIFKSAWHVLTLQLIEV